MKNPDVKGICGGLFVSALGLLFFVKAFDYELGTSQRMGPGYFPAVIGAATVAVGIALMIPALWRPGVRPPISWRPLIAVSTGIAVFGITMRYLGLIPAIFVTVITCSLGDSSSRPLVTLVLAGFAALTWWLVRDIRIDRLEADVAAHAERESGRLLPPGGWQQFEVLLARSLGAREPGKVLLLIEDGVYGALKGGSTGEAIAAGLKGQLKLYVLGPDLAARGIPAARLIDGVTVVDYAGFVDLVTSHKVTQAWL